GGEYAVVERIQADRYPSQPGILERLGLLAQKRAVGGKREVDGIAIGSTQGSQHGDQLFDVLAQQRLATGEAYLAYPIGHCQPREPGDFVEIQQGGAGQEGMIGPEELAGHTVGTPKIATISN